MSVRELGWESILRVLATYRPWKTWKTDETKLLMALAMDTEEEWCQDSGRKLGVIRIYFLERSEVSGGKRCLV